jgi:hypothetical protein
MQEMLQKRQSSSQIEEGKSASFLWSILAFQ